MDYISKKIVNNTFSTTGITSIPSDGFVSQIFTGSITNNINNAFIVFTLLFTTYPNSMVTDILSRKTFGQLFLYNLSTHRTSNLSENRFLSNLKINGGVITEDNTVGLTTYHYKLCFMTNYIKTFDPYNMFIKTQSSYNSATGFRLQATIYGVEESIQ